MSNTPIPPRPTATEKIRIAAATKIADCMVGNGFIKDREKTGLSLI